MVIQSADNWLQIYNSQGHYVSSCKDVPAAVILMSLYGKGSQVRKDDTEEGLLWHEGFETQVASAGMNFAAALINARAKPLPRI